MPLRQGARSCASDVVGLRSRATGVARLEAVAALFACSFCSLVHVLSGKRGTGQISWIETPNGYAATRGDADRLNCSLAIFLPERFVTGAVPAKHWRFVSVRPTARIDMKFV